MRAWGGWFSGCLLFAAAASAQTDPASVGQWSALANWGFPATHAHLSADGRVIWWPEYAAGDTPTAWDPATGANIRLPKAGFNLFCSGHALTPNGGIFVAGGHIDNDRGLATASIFDPSASVWTRLPDMNAGRWYPTVTSLPDGDVLVLSGEITLQTGNNPLPQVWESSAGRWRNLTSASRSLPLYPWVFVAPSGNVFVAGPGSRSLFLSTSGTGGWSNGPAAHFSPERTYGSAVMYEPGKILIAGGAPLDSIPSDTMEAIDLSAAAPAWRSVAPLRTPRRQLNLTVLPDGTVLVTGGHSGVGRDNPNAPVLQTELWNPATEQTTVLAPSNAYRGYHSTAVLLADGRVLSAGGTNVNTAQVFSPPYLFRGPRPQITSAPTELTYGQSFEVASADAPRIAQVNLVRLTSVTHSINMNQRFNRLTFTTSSTGVTAHAPDRPEMAPPGHYLLFVLDGAGVPSVGRIVRLSGSAAPPPPPPPPPAGGIAMGSVWHYDDRNIDPGPAWTSLSFDDSAWKSGPGQLGYGDGDEATLLVHMNPAQPSYYFRKKIAVAQPASAKVRVIHDDGVAVYVNGSLSFSKYMARGLAHSLYASATSADNELDTFTVPASAFVTGDNIVAVMVKQSNGTSSDVSFDLELTFDSQPPPPPPPPPGRLTVSAPNGGETLTAGSTFDVRWTSEGNIATVRLELSQDGGASWGRIGDTANSGHFSWTVPSLDTTRALLRVSDVSTPAVTDQSNGPFAIHPQPAAGFLVKFGDVWKYDDRNVDPGPTWTSAAFDDSGWRSGAGQLGYGDGDEATVLLHMNPAQPSYYFRKKISVSEPAATTVKVIHDDGVAVYLNGSLVFSKYVAKGLGHAIYASATSADNELDTFTLPASAFAAGENVLAVLIKQANATSSDVSFDLEMVAGGATAPAPVVVVQHGDIWKYDDRNVDPGPAWTSAAFDDTAWKSGPSQLGYGDGDEATVLVHMNPAQPSYYFRKKITLGKALSAARVEAVHDDGIAVWVNGRQVFSKYVASTAHSAYATATSADNEVSSFTIDPSAFVAGENVVAVMIKQANATSSDISFDFKLTVTPAP